MTRKIVDCRESPATSGLTGLALLTLSRSENGHGEGAVTDPKAAGQERRVAGDRRKGTGERRCGADSSDG